MKSKIIFLSLIVLSGFEVAAFTQSEVSGVDAQVVMDAFKDLGRTTSQSNPLSGALLNLAFGYKLGGFEIGCRISNPGIVSRGTCKVNANTEASPERGLVITRMDRLTTVEIREPEAVQKISQGLPQNPWKSESRLPDGRERLSLSCADVCRMTIAD